MRSMVEHVHELLEKQKVEVAIDFTMGNGYDTLALSKIATKVYSFDIQQVAIEQTKKLLDNVANVTLIKDNHLYFDTYITAFDIGIFNLGYLPNANTDITTHVDNTLATIKKAITLLNKSGTLYIVIYIGHTEGKKESDAIVSYVQTLHHRDYNVAMFRMLNKKQAPYVIEVEKR